MHLGGNTSPVHSPQHSHTPRKDTTGGMTGTGGMTNNNVWFLHLRKPTCSILFSRSPNQSSSGVVLSVSCVKSGAPVKFWTFQEVLLLCVFTDTPVLPKRFPARFHSEDEVAEEPGCCSRCAEMSKDKFQSKSTKYSHIPAPPTATRDNNVRTINLDHRYYHQAN